MSEAIDDVVLRLLGAGAVAQRETIQRLWSGYGEIVKLSLSDSPIASVVVKHVFLPAKDEHPRGWNTDLSHARKLRSYAVEMAWYQQWAQRCGSESYVAQCYAAQSHKDDYLIVMEDLDASGYSARRSHLDNNHARLCLTWLANFHANFMGEAPEGLWPVGSYWHLATRPDEWQAMAESPLKRAATRIDEMLNNTRYQTFVHGDAKVANFCFSADSSRVAAVDFQYVGAGCGMKDVVYFLGSCLTEEECERWNEALLDDYFEALKQALDARNKHVDWAELEQEWRALFAVAWADFYRFLLGWMPDHHKVNKYSERLTESVLADIGSV